MKMLAKAKYLYNPKNPKHQGKDLVDTLYYAKEDFEILVEKDNVLKLSPKLIIDEINTKIGKKILLRDWRKDLPDLKEIENLSDSYGTFIAYLATEKVKEGVVNLSSKEKEKFLEILNKIIPQIE